MNTETTLLLMDENAEVGALLAERLMAARGFRVVAQTGNPLIAAELAHQWQPDIIIADFNKRGRYGAEMYRWLKRASPQSSLVVLTSYMRNGDEELYRKAGAQKCLLKGLPMRELLEELRGLAEWEKEGVHVPADTRHA
jgi:DNA-binding NarL/FixJ family response regulator